MNLAEIIQPHPEDAVALVSRGTPTTYGALREQVAALRGGLSALGLGPDDRVALLCANNPHLRRLVSGRARHRRRRRPPQPPEPRTRARARAGRGRDRRRHRRPRRPRELGRRRARERTFGAARDRDCGSPVRRCPHVRRPPRGRPRSGRRPCRRRRGRAALHERHRRLGEGGDAHPREPLVQPPPDPGPAGRADWRPTTWCSGCSRCSTSSG